MYVCVYLRSISFLDYAKAGQLAKEYASTKGPGTTAKPQNHLFFRKLSPIVQRTLERCVRENGFMLVTQNIFVLVMLMVSVIHGCSGLVVVLWL